MDGKKSCMKKIVVASDSFKGSLSSLEIALSAERAVRKVFPDCEVLKIPVADGGEGTVEALVDAMDGKVVRCAAHGPLMNRIDAAYGLFGDTAIIEMAAASGLTLVPKEQRNPMQTTTYGTGDLIRDALRRGCRHFLVGIGGSATNDAGTGMLQSLGFRFLDKDGKELGQGGGILRSIHYIDTAGILPGLEEATFTIACDVGNPFAGKNGAAHVYARQKGADDAMIEELDEGLTCFAEVIKRQTGKDISHIPGAGAAGGLGGGFIAFLGATLKPGIDMVLETLNFDARIKGADLVITGEGRIDRQTAMGKTPAGVLRAARKQQIPTIAIGGAVEEADALNELGFAGVFPIQPGPVSLEQAMDKEFAARNIERTVEQLLLLLNTETRRHGDI